MDFSIHMSPLGNANDFSFMFTNQMVPGSQRRLTTRKLDRQEQTDTAQTNASLTRNHRESSEMHAEKYTMAQMCLMDPH
jgi:hypothetical protein